MGLKFYGQSPIEREGPVDVLGSSQAGAEGTVYNSVRSMAAVARVLVRGMNSRRRAGAL